MFKDPELEGFFDQLISYQILIDMLYERGRYQDVIDVFQIVKSRQIQGGLYPPHVMVLVFAACYKEVRYQFIILIALILNKLINRILQNRLNIRLNYGPS